MSETVDFRRCSTCERVFGRSRFMVRRNTLTCGSCQRAARTSPERMRQIAYRSHEVQRNRRLAALEPRLASLSKVECYRLGREDEYNRLRAKVKRDLTARVAS